MWSLFLAAPFILLALAEAGVIGLNRRHPKRWPVLAVATYLAVAALALAFGFAGRKTDEFGFGWLPAILLTDPFYFLAPQVMLQHMLLMTILGAIVISVVLYTVTAFLGYPKSSYSLAAPPDPAEESTHQP